MKLEDKAIDQIVAMFDAEIAEIAKTVEKAGADAKTAVDAAAEDAEVADEAAGELLAEAEEEPAVAGAEPEEPVIVDVAEEEPATEPETSVADEITDAPADEPEAPTEDATPEATPETPAGSTASKSILGAVGYLLAVIAICALSVVCINLLDNSIQKMKPADIPDVPQADLAASLQAYTTNEVFAQKAVPQLSLEEIYVLDLRKPSGATEDDLKRVTKAGLVGLEDTFIEAEKKYGVNAIFLMSIASLESAHGTQMYRPNNMFGYGGKSYPSKEACIMDVASGLSSRYLAPGASLYGGSPTLSGVNKRYAANPQWYAKVGKYMKSYYDVIAPYHNQTLDKLK